MRTKQIRNSDDRSGKRRPDITQVLLPDRTDQGRSTIRLVSTRPPLWKLQK